jgi:hypothetical protein
VKDSKLLLLLNTTSKSRSLRCHRNRSSLLEHLADVQGHRCLVSGDSLPMHLGLGSAVCCVSIFTCASPWQISGTLLSDISGVNCSNPIDFEKPSDRPHPINLLN